MLLSIHVKIGWPHFPIINKLCGADKNLENALEFAATERRRFSLTILESGLIVNAIFGIIRVQIIPYGWPYVAIKSMHQMGKADPID